MKQLFLWFMTGVFAAWALYAAYQLAGGWAAAVKRAGPWADRTHVAWPTEVTQQMLVVVLGLLSAIGFAAFAADNRWEQRLRNNCQCNTVECRCTIDTDLLYNHPSGDTD